MTTLTGAPDYTVLWQHGPFECALIGDPVCPLIKRWNLRLPTRLGTLRLHWFLPDTADRAPHDHPWPFWTLVLWGRYLDVARDGTVDRMRPGKVRHRAATHAHQTVAGPRGCLTLVHSRPDTREWGFWHTDGQWWPQKLWRDTFGAGMVCEHREDA